MNKLLTALIVSAFALAGVPAQAASHAGAMPAAGASAPAKAERTGRKPPRQGKAGAGTSPRGNQQRKAPHPVLEKLFELYTKMTAADKAKPAAKAAPKAAAKPAAKKPAAKPSPKSKKA